MDSVIRVDVHVCGECIVARLAPWWAMRGVSLVALKVLFARGVVGPLLRCEDVFGRLDE
jgi:hypothetical protein